MRGATRMLLPAIVVLGALAASPVSAAEQNYIDRFDGAWGGSGLVIRNERTGPTKVNCTFTGTGEANRINVAGTCRAYAIFSRSVKVDVTYRPETGLYTGTYVGSSIGTARLSGKRSGDTVNLSLVWPREVMGDTMANMSITASSDGRLRVLVNDKVGEGPVQSVTDIALRNK